MRTIGQRIGAVRNADEQTAYLFGFGTYQWDEVPPDDVQGPFGRLGLFGIKNPKLVMDDGTIVWGCESWWGDEAKVMKMVGARRIEIVKPTRSPATRAERRAAAKIVRESEARVAEVMGELKARGDATPTGGTK